jgi:hypothetical protein
MIDFPNAPTNGQIFTSGGSTWTYDGSKWVASGTIPLTPQATGDNRIINGDMRIDQRNGGSPGSANGYTIDRWGVLSNPINHFTWGRSLNNNPFVAATGFPYYLGLQAATGYAAAAGDIFQVYQPIEADMVSDFAWGTASAQSVTLSFWAYSSLTGSFSGSIRNYAATRSYPFTYSLPSANTWTKITVTIPGDTAGTWVMSGNSGAMYVNFDLGSGSTGRGPANAWATTTSPGYIGATGSVSVVATTSATFYVTGVKLEIGPVATPYNRQSLTKSMADCQRYYQGYFWNGSQYGAAAGAANMTSVTLPTAMRAAPTVVFASPNYSNCSAVTIQGSDVQYFIPRVTVTATGAFVCNATVNSSAEL